MFIHVHLLSVYSSVHMYVIMQLSRTTLWRAVVTHNQLMYDAAVQTEDNVQVGMTVCEEFARKSAFKAHHIYSSTCTST